MAEVIPEVGPVAVGSEMVPEVAVLPEVGAGVTTPPSVPGPLMSLTPLAHSVDRKWIVLDPWGNAVSLIVVMTSVVVEETAVGTLVEAAQSMPWNRNRSSAS